MMPALFVLTYGLMGSTGNSIASGVTIALSLVLLVALTLRQPLIFDQVDVAFGAIVLAAFISSLTAPLPPAMKGWHWR